MDKKQASRIQHQPTPTTEREKLYCVRLDRIAANLGAAFGPNAAIQIQALAELRLELIGQVADTPLSAHEKKLLANARDGLQRTKAHALRMGHAEQDKIDGRGRPKKHDDFPTVFDGDKELTF